MILGERRCQDEVVAEIEVAERAGARVRQTRSTRNGSSNGAWKRRGTGISSSQRGHAEGERGKGKEPRERSEEESVGSQKGGRV